MDSDDDYHNIDKFDRNDNKEKFDSDESDKDEKVKERMKRRLKNKQKRDMQKKDDIDINAFISGGMEENKDNTEDTEPTEDKKSKKMSKKEKKKAKQQAKSAKEEDNDEEEKIDPNEETKGDDEEEKEVKLPKKKKKDKNKFPLKVYYCAKCTCPPEYCAIVSQDLEACKADLKERVPKLYSVIYEERADEVNEEAKGKKKKIKSMKKNKEITKATQFKVVKYKRGGKKMVTEIYGMDGYGINLKDLSKKLGKKFACGNSLIKSEDTQESIVQFLGDIDEDAFMIALSDQFPEIAVAKFKFESGGNKKGRKKK